MVFNSTHQQCLTSLTISGFLHAKLPNQKRGKFLNCWLQTWEDSQGKDHSVIAIVFIHFPQTSVTGHWEKWVILLQTLVWPRMTVFTFWLIALIQHHSQTPINPLTCSSTLTYLNLEIGNTAKKILLSLEYLQIQPSLPILSSLKPSLICCHFPIPLIHRVLLKR